MITHTNISPYCLEDKWSFRQQYPFLAVRNISSDVYTSNNLENRSALDFTAALKALFSIASRLGVVLSLILLQISNRSSIVTERIVATFRDI